MSVFGSDAFSSWGRRAWADLGDGPAGLIAELLLANDVADYVRFRAVCRPWRRCSADPSSGFSLDGRFLPRKWVMLDKAHAGPCRRRFLNISTGECIRTDLPELASGYTLLALTPEGLLLLVHEHTLVARLVNPLTRQLTDLPPVTALLAREQQRAWRSGCASAGDIIWVHGVGIADASAVAVCFSSPRVLAVARPGDGCWTVVDANRYVDSALACAGRFYCASGNCVMVLDTSDPDGQPLRLRPVAGESFCFSRISATLHLIDNAGELMLVHRMLLRDTAARGGQVKYKRKYAVLKVDLDAGALVPAKDLGGRSVLLSLGRTISVPAGAFPSVTADTLYFGFDCDEKTRLNQIDAYNVADGSSQPCNHRSRVGIVQPWSAVDCLAYCIQGNGEHLA